MTGDAIFRVDMADGIAVVTFDLPGSPVNIFTAAVRDAFPPMLARLQADATVRAIVFVSGKPDSFIAGADAEELGRIGSATEAERLSREGHALLDRVERSRAPVVAAIHGACLGGGLELAMACAYRIATDHPKTTLGLPEVQLGILPGGGGTQRMPRLVGLATALDMMLAGKAVKARKARAIGLVHEVVHPAILRQVALARARELAAGTRAIPAPQGGRGAQAALLEGNSLGRAVVFRKAREQVLAKTRGNYPAPLAILDAVAAGYASRERGFAEEARRFGELTQTPVARELSYLFFATTAMKKDPGVPGTAPAPHPVPRIAVLGAGFMGAGIAAVTAQQGIGVALKDAAHERVLAGLRGVRDILRQRLDRKAITRRQFADQLALVHGTVSHDGIAGVPLVVEAVFEDLRVKHEVLRDVEPLLPPHGVFASNTSTIPIAAIARAAARPERVLGLHFFSPVEKMPLLEVIVTPGTAPDAVTTAVAYGRRLGKTIVVVRDGPGFYVNRILAPYINEAGRLLDEGATIDAIDRALVAFGFPVGPMTLLDEVGLDIAGKSGAIVREAFGARMEPSQALQAVVRAGRLGRKGRSGFYAYDAKGRKQGVDASVYDLLPTGRPRGDVPAAEIVQRCTLAMVNEAARCLEEGIIASPRDGDIGAVFGIGFPPFRGGPFRHADALGVARVVEELEARFPGRFAPAESLVQLARRGGRFHPA
ncbi:MAG: fatty acid oxidation complex subunit alpha FadJ [Gemmatimonadota bacterium]|jgi:3-hydroxyacyl-CoA dehydrogenase/enoyl-CoA hydratase/3-hydroxybutyryl-CoA epimerase|nr:fatty acid oxidation complex subunit alpha FadJ [Gemmatimonadota bacterium]